MADLFVFARANWENLLPESSTKILKVHLGSYTLIFFGQFLALILSNCSVTVIGDFSLHCKLTYRHCLASSPIGIAYVHTLFSIVRVNYRISWKS